MNQVDSTGKVLVGNWGNCQFGCPMGNLQGAEEDRTTGDNYSLNYSDGKTKDCNIGGSLLE